MNKKLLKKCEQYGFTNRQREILCAFWNGQTRKEICYRFGISDSTYREHTYAIFQKTGKARLHDVCRFFLGD